MASTPERKVSEEASAALVRLRAIADGIPDRAFGGRLRKVFEAGSVAISGLGSLTLDKYDELAEPGAPALSMWEELAPVIRDTLIDVNRLLSTVRELFPTGSGPIGDLIGEALDEAVQGDQTAVLLRLHEEEATQQIQSLGNTIATEISNLGERMRSPQVVSDRWNLLSDLQEYRGKFRTLVGDLIFASVSSFSAVNRAEVIPHYVEDLRDSLMARRAVTDLARVMAVHQARIRDAKPGQAGEPVQALVKDLDAFGRSKAYAVLRTPDKRRCVEFRALLRKFPKILNAAATAKAVGEFAQFAHGLSNINHRTLLMDHDREVLAACAVKLENADQLRAKSPAEALSRFAEATAQAQEIYGRYPALDAWLRKNRKRVPSSLSPSELASEIELLRGLLAGATSL